MVIVEGIPTAMGESPAPLIEQSKTRDTAQALSYTKGEGMYAITLAIAHTIPFVGGEPTREQEIQALERKGFTPPDIAFNYHLGSISQAIRSGELANAHDPKLMQAFDDSARAYVDQFKLEPLSFADFIARYRAIFGIDFADDSQLHYRSDPSTANPVARLAQISMISRDEHLLATIEDAIAVKKQLLVVYGGSHWTTLSRALEKRFGKPAVRSFAE